MHPAEVCETLRDAEAVAILSESIGGLLQADGSFSLGKILDDNTVKLTLVCLSVCVFYQNVIILYKKNKKNRQQIKIMITYFVLYLRFY